MAKAIVTIKIMPESPEEDLAVISEQAKKYISENGGEVGKEEIEPIAFGLKAVKLLYIVDEALGGTDAVETAVSGIKGVQSAEVVDVRRALG